VRERGRIALVLGLGQALGRGGIAVYTVVMVRVLSQAEYGDFALAVAISAIASSLADVGFSRLIVRDVARAQEKPGLVRDLMRVRFLGVAAVAVLVTLAGLIGVLPFDAAVSAGLIAFLTGEAISFGYESAAVATERPWRFTFVQALGTVLLAVAVVLVASADRPDPALALAGLGAASCLKALVHAVLWRRLARSRGPALRALPVRHWVRQAFPFLALAILATLYYRLGIVILHVGRGAEETAPFAAALRVMDAFALIGYVGFSVVSPALSRAHRDRPEDLWRLWKRMMRTAAAAVVPLAVLIALTAEDVARILFGDRYAESAGGVLRLLAPGIAFMLLQNLSVAVVLMGADTRSVVKLTVATVTANLALAVVLSSAAGADGVAVATSAAELISFTAFALLIRRRYATGRPAGSGTVPGVRTLPALDP
jgi:O-antigen/teichoic acid export membrane protein